MEDNLRMYSKAGYRRMQQLEECLYQMLLAMSYDEINVTTLCEQAGLTRRGFYKYFHSKEHCLCSIIDRKIQEAVFYAMGQSGRDASREEYCTLLLEYWKNQQEFFDVLSANQLFRLFIQRSTHNALKEEYTLPYRKDIPLCHGDQDFLAYDIGSRMNLLIQWYMRGFDTPVEDLAKKYMKIIAYDWQGTLRT